MTTTEPNKTRIGRPDWLTPEIWPFEIRTADVDDSSIAYTDEGSGPTLLLVHDGMWSYIWGQLIGELRQDFRVVTLDFPGSGLSPDSDHTAGLESDSKLLQAFVGQLDLSQITFVMHDLGGAVGLGVAARRPDLVAGMVMVNTFAWPPKSRSLRTMLRLVSSGPMTGLNVGTNMIPKLSTGSRGIGRHLEESSREAFLGPYREKGPRRRFHTLMGSALSETDYLHSLELTLRSALSDKPVLTVYGEKNDPFGFQTRFRELFPEAEEMVIPNGNHFPMCDDPSGVANRIREWHRRL